MRHEGESLGAGGSNFGVLGGVPSCVSPPKPPQMLTLGFCTPCPLPLPEFLLISPKTAQTSSRRGHSTPLPVGAPPAPKEFGEAKAILTPPDPHPPGPCHHGPITPAPLVCGVSPVSLPGIASPWPGGAQWGRVLGPRAGLAVRARGEAVILGKGVGTHMGEAKPAPLGQAKVMGLGHRQVWDRSGV